MRWRGARGCLLRPENLRRLRELADLNARGPALDADGLAHEAVYELATDRGELKVLPEPEAPAATTTYLESRQASR